LASLDDKAYGLIIGLPEIKQFQLLEHFASQFSDCKDVDDSVTRWQVATLENIPRGDAISNKFAILPEDLVGIKHPGSRPTLCAIRSLTRFLAPTVNARLTPNCNRQKDMLGITTEDNEESSPVVINAIGSSETENSFRPAHIYDEDDEVIDRSSWSDAWQRKRRD